MDTLFLFLTQGRHFSSQGARAAATGQRTAIMIIVRYDFCEKVVCTICIKSILRYWYYDIDDVVNFSILLLSCCFICFIRTYECSKEIKTNKYSHKQYIDNIDVLAHTKAINRVLSRHVLGGNFPPPKKNLQFPPKNFCHVGNYNLNVEGQK